MISKAPMKHRFSFPSKNKNTPNKNNTNQGLSLTSLQTSLLKKSPKKTEKKKNQDKLIEKFTILSKAKGERLQLAIENNEKMKIQEELKECTFTPKINKRSAKMASSKSTEKSNFYTRNINWLHSVKGKQARMKQIKEITKCEYPYKPSIINAPKIEELFNNKDTLTYWIKNNQLYLNRHLNKYNNSQKVARPKYKYHTKNNSMIIHKNGSLYSGTITESKKNSTINRSLDLLHYELQNTVIDDEYSNCEEERNRYKNEDE